MDVFWDTVLFNYNLVSTTTIYFNNKYAGPPYNRTKIYAARTSRKRQQLLIDIQGP